MLLGFLEILSMCVFQETVAWKSTPRYFVASSVFMMCPISLWEGGLKGVWILIHSGHCISEDGIPCPTWIPTLQKYQGLAVGRHNHYAHITVHTLCSHLQTNVSGYEIVWRSLMTLTIYHQSFTHNII